MYNCTYYMYMTNHYFPFRHPRIPSRGSMIVASETSSQARRVKKILLIETITSMLQTTLVYRFTRMYVCMDECKIHHQADPRISDADQ